jgi:hypothetical protein
MQSALTLAATYINSPTFTLTLMTDPKCSVESNSSSNLKPLPSCSGNAPTRQLYLLAVNNGKILADMNHSSPIWTAAPLEAVAQGLAWLSFQVATEKLALVRELMPGHAICIATLALISDKAGGWIPTSFTFPID